MNNKQELKELAQLAEIFAEAAMDLVETHPDALKAVDEVLTPDEGNEMFMLETEIVTALITGQVDDMFGDIEKGKEQEYIDEMNDKLAPKIVRLSELYSRVATHLYGDGKTASLFPEEARTKEVSEKFAKYNAPTLARLTNIPPAPPAFPR